MRAEFFRPDAPDEVVGAVEWDGRRPIVRADDEDVRTVLRRVFRPSPVPVTGPRGESLAEPGDLDWFLAAATVRGEQEGLQTRFVTGSPGGWDPAGSYEPMGAWVGRREGDHGIRRSLGTPRA